MISKTIRKLQNIAQIKRKFSRFIKPTVLKSVKFLLFLKTL